MEEEKGDDAGRSQEQVGSTMKFSFTASKPKFSASRPPLFPRGKQRSDEGEDRKDVEFVTAFDEQGIVAKDPKGLRGARVIPKLENSWRPEKRMKNIMMETDIMTSSEERFEKEETVVGGPNPGVHYGLTVGIKKVETAIHVTTVVTQQNGSTKEDTTGEINEQTPALTFAQLEDKRLRQDLVSLPDVADMDAYEEMPVENFGEALLRGMGWEKGQPIGLNSKVAVVPVEYVRRSGRTGLGAEPAVKEVNNSRQIKPGESRVAAPELVASVGPDGRVRHVVTVDENLVERSRKGVVKGKLMSIISGRHLGLRGEVLDSEKSDRISVKLVKSGEKVVVSAKDLADIGSLEEEKVLKQIRQLKIGNGEVSRREDRKADYDDVEKEETLAGRKEDKNHGRKEDRREGRRDKDTRRDERAEYKREEEERSSRSRRDSRRDERVDEEDQTRSNSRDGRRERKRESYERTNDEMEVDDEDRVRRSEDRRASARDQKREERRDEGRRGESRRDGRREDERSHREQGRSNQNRDERGGGRDRRGNYNDNRSSDDRHEKERGASDGGIIDRDASRDASEATIEGRYKDSWLTSQIRVRIISKTLKGGKLYLKKGRIVDVVTPKECDILLDESGEVLQQIKQDQLETALPKRGGRIMVVGGKHRGLLGKLIERNSEGEVGVVQMEESFDLVTLDLDLLAEFIGDASERDD